MMEAIHSPEMSGLVRATWHKIPEDGILHSHCHGLLKSYTIRGTLRNNNEFDRTVRSSYRVKGQFRLNTSSEKAVQDVQEPSQPNPLVGPGRRVGAVGPRETLKCIVSTN
jgi:hypothetical protein